MSAFLRELGVFSDSLQLSKFMFFWSFQGFCCILYVFFFEIIISSLNVCCVFKDSIRYLSV